MEISFQAQSGYSDNEMIGVPSLAKGPFEPTWVAYKLVANNNYPIQLASPPFSCTDKSLNPPIILFIFSIPPYL